ncbi:rCG62311 [Rattus norvegicus]|uniref:glyceraldehyde-3-phosphate dehydrogenase (phosphorylating) n=1 Tax=Rattus norvegicus TaxID=10116 RepID=A6H998_RAT|nr:rCG62311 [Rattus norvegicus]
MKGEAKRLIILTPSANVPKFVMVMNHQLLSTLPKICHTDLSCNFGIIKGLMTMVHAITTIQKIIDGSSGKLWHDGHRHAQTITLSSTGAEKLWTKPSQG